MRLVLIPLFLLCTHAVHAQTTVYGRVLDAVTRLPLVAATVQVEGTTRGTISNPEGLFTLRVDSLPATLVSRYVGYNSGRVRIEREPDAQVLLLLQPAPQTLQGVEITDEDPGERIMREVIARAERQRQTLTSFTADAYARFSIANDTGIVSITESLAQVFWRKDGGFRERILAQERTANFPQEALLPAASTVINLSDANQNISGYRFVGVTHPRALDVYRFTLVGSRGMDGMRVFDIDVQPESPLSVAFSGRVSVLDSAFVLLEADLTPGPAFRFPTPIQRYDVRYQQQYAEFGDGFWVPVDFRSSAVVEIGAGPLLRLPPIRIQQVSRLSDYVPNAATPDSLYEQGRRVQRDSVALAAGVRIEQRDLRVPLSVEEERAYAQIDSTQRIADAFQARGAASRFVRVNDGDDEPTSPRRLRFAPIALANRVEGARLGGMATFRLAPVTLQGRLHYGTASTEWGGGGMATVRVGRVRFMAEASDEVAAWGSSRTNNAFFNSIDVLLNRGDYFEYGHRTQFGAAVEVRPAPQRRRRAAPLWRRPVLSAGVWQETWHSVDAQSRFTVWGEREPRPVVASSEGTFVYGRGEIRWGGSPAAAGFVPVRALRLRVEQSLAGSDAAFTTASFQYDTYVETFARRRFLPATLFVQVSGHVHTGGVRQYMGVVEASRRGFTPFGTLRTLQPLPYRAEQAAQVAWEHTFRTIPFELVGLTALADLNWSVLVHGGHGFTRGEALHPAPRNGHHEIGMGLAGLFEVLRIDLTQRLDAPGRTVGIAATRFF